MDTMQTDGSEVGVQCKSEDNNEQRIVVITKMSNRKVCYIFHHEKFEENLQLANRNGSKNDRDALRTTFSTLGFAVTVFEDLSYDNVKKELSKISQDSSANDIDCLICCVLSYGEYDTLYAYDQAYPLSALFAPFTRKKCPAMYEKPKLFFVQTCSYQPVEEDDDDRSGGKVPRYADYQTSYCDCDLPYNSIPLLFETLLVHSTVPGHLSWREDDSDDSENVFLVCSLFDKTD